MMKPTLNSEPPTNIVITYIQYIHPVKKLDDMKINQGISAVKR